MPIYVRIVMYGLRLFIVVLQELHCLHNFYDYCSVFKEMCIPSFAYCVRELHVYGHLCSYCNVWPGAVYSCFTCLPNCLHVGFMSYHFTKFCCSKHSSYRDVRLPEGVC